MQHIVHRPRSPLDEIVDHLWCLRDTPGHARERIVPSGTIELVINLADDVFRIYTGRECELRGAIVSGCYTRAFEFDTRAHTLAIGVHFKPGVAARILGVPPGALANMHVGLDELWGADALELREQLCETRSVQGRFERLEAALLARIAARPHRPAVIAGLAELDAADIEIGSVAKRIGLSRRRFIEVFTEDVGMTPKRYAMVQRFQRALAIARPRAWAQVAAACGYYDQAHLCRDWSALTGLSPTEFLARRESLKPNHVVGSHSSNPDPDRGRRLRA